MWKRILKGGITFILLSVAVISDYIFLKSEIKGFSLKDVDEITAFERYLKEIRNLLPPQGIIGYFDDEKGDPNVTNKIYVLLQYTISPLILKYNILGYPFIFAHIKDPSSLEFLTNGPFVVVKPISSSLFLLKREDEKLKNYVDFSENEHIFQIYGDWKEKLNLGEAVFKKVGKKFGCILKMKNSGNKVLMEIFPLLTRSGKPFKLHIYINGRKSGEIEIERGRFYTLHLLIPEEEQKKDLIDLKFVDASEEKEVKGTVMIKRITLAKE